MGVKQLWELLAPTGARGVTAGPTRGSALRARRRLTTRNADAGVRVEVETLAGKRVAVGAPPARPAARRGPPSLTPPHPSRRADASIWLVQFIKARLARQACLAGR